MPKNTSDSAPIARREPRVAEQPHVQRGVPDPGLVPDEEGEYRQAAERRAEHVRVHPGALVAALDDAVHEEHQAGDGGEHADEVDPPGAGVLRLGHQQRGRHHARGAERHVDQEHRAPPEVDEQQAADDGADGDADADGDGPDPDGAGRAPRGRTRWR